jgi:peptidylprolyl isomerase
VDEEIAMRLLRRGPALLVVAAVLLLGCSGEETTAEAPVSNDGEEDSVSEDLEARPDTTGLVPADTDPPAALVVEDVAVGDGPGAGDGDRLVVDYVGVRWSDGGEFDASWERGQPFEVTLGAGQVIPGWEQGLQGMQVGGRRIITIPPDLAYGDRGAGGVIGPGETLVFVVDLREIG